MNKEKVEKKLFALHSEVKALTEEIQALNQDIERLDYSDTKKAVSEVERLEGAIRSRNQVLKVVQAQVRLEEKNLEDILNAEKAQLLKGLREREHQALLDIVKALEHLQASFEELEGVKAEIRSMRAQPEYIVQLNDVQDALKPALKQLKGFRPGWFGLPERPSKQEQLLNSARQSVKNFETQLKDLQKREGKWNSGVQREHVDAATERLEVAREQLERLEGVAP